MECLKKSSFPSYEYLVNQCADADKLMPKVFEAPGQGWLVVRTAEYYLPRKVQLLFFS